MTLGELIRILEKADPNLIVKQGFNEPHSYRGYYDQLAFKPAENIPVREMLTAAKYAVNNEFGGYKGGMYRMTEDTVVWLAEWGSCGEEMNPIILGFMLGEADDSLRGKSLQAMRELNRLLDEFNEAHKLSGGKGYIATKGASQNLLGWLTMHSFMGHVAVIMGAERI